MSKYKVKAMYFPNGPNHIHKSGEIIEAHQIVGGPAKIEEAIKNGFLVPLDKKNDK